MKYQFMDIAQEISCLTIFFVLLGFIFIHFGLFYIWGITSAIKAKRKLAWTKYTTPLVRYIHRVYDRSKYIFQQFAMPFIFFTE